jgi:hypothetical protein
VTLTERHNQRARGLRQTFNQEGLAEFLHQNYRAAFKALHRQEEMSTEGPGCINEHDHGWGKCHKQKYFMHRAARLLRDEKEK